MLILELHVNFNFAMPAVSARGALLVSSPRKTYEVQHLSEWAGGGPDTYIYIHMLTGASNSHDGQHPTPPRPNACVGARAGARCVTGCVHE